MTVWNEDRLARAAQIAGMKHKGDGRWAGAGHSWELHRHPAGFVCFCRPFSVVDGEEPLTLHDSWAGPFKLAHRQGKLEQRCDLFVSPSFEDLDEEVAGQLELLLGKVMQRLDSINQNSLDPDWQAPDSQKLLDWLSQGGNQVTLDEQQNLRMTLKRSGATARIRLIRQGGLRFVLPLGEWEGIDPSVQRAILLLARRANDVNRLARIVWRSGENRHCVEAQVDLSGLATENIDEKFWKEWILISVAALELAFRQLALEFLVLADPVNRRFVDQWLAHQQGGADLIAPVLVTGGAPG